MKASSENVFRKTLACPSSTLLLAFRSAALSPEVENLVNKHLSNCDFCTAELSLLGHHQPPEKRSRKIPELPINLRILAESLLSQSKFGNQPPNTRHGLRLSD